MREYDELYDWLAQSKLLAYMDNFAASGFDLSAMADLTAEVSPDLIQTRDYVTCEPCLEKIDIVFYLLGFIRNSHNKNWSSQTTFIRGVQTVKTCIHVRGMVILYPRKYS